jgi:uncharacterized protein
MGKPAKLRVENLSRDNVLVSEGRVAKNLWTRLKGLIGTHELPTGDGLLIHPCNGVHCMFMSIPIDVLYVDKSDKVIALDRAMQPWRIGKIYRASRYVVELPAGTIERTGTAVGDQLKVGY